LKLSHLFKGLLLRLYVVVCIIEWLCKFFLGLWSCLGPKSINYSFLDRCRRRLHCCCCCYFNRVCINSIHFLPLLASSSDDGIIDCNGFLVLWRRLIGTTHLIDWFCLLLSSLTLLLFIVVTSFIGSIAFDHGIASSCLLIEALRRPPRYCSCWFDSCFLFVTSVSILNLKFLFSPLLFSVICCTFFCYYTLLLLFCTYRIAPVSVPDSKGWCWLPLRNHFLLDRRCFFLYEAQLFRSLIVTKTNLDGSI
jgi:hypothetical protein